MGFYIRVCKQLGYIDFPTRLVGGKFIALLPTVTSAQLGITIY